MTDLINGRTPGEIKRVLEWANCACGGMVCEECQYYKSVCSHENFERIAPDALAYIEQLEVALKCEQVARTVLMEDMPKWINVEDRLPESHDEKADCFLVTDGTFIWMAYYACKEWQFAECTDSLYVIDWTEITHWMPLPQPPEEE